MRKNIISLNLIFFALNIGFSQESIDKYIIFSELDIEYTNDPYYSFNEEWDAKHRRYYALVHETIYEPTNESNLLTLNFAKDKIEYKYNNLPNDFKSQVIISLPDQFGFSWSFHDSINIQARDITYSIKYAICSGVIPSELISYDDVDFDDQSNKITISSRTRIPVATYKGYLKDTFVIPFSCFGDYVSQGCEIISMPFNQQYLDDDAIFDYNDKPATHMFSAGPFEFKEKVPNQKISLEKFNKYFKGTSNNNGFIITQNPLKSTYASRLQDKQTNLAINIPDMSFDADQSTYIEKKKLETYSAKYFMINFTEHGNPNLRNKSFRKAISYLIPRDDIVSQRFKGAAVTLTGPYSNVSTYYNTTLNHFKDMKYDAENNYEGWSTSNPFDPHDENDRLDLVKQILESDGYIFNGDKISKDPNGRDIEPLTLIYYNGITQQESDAITLTIPGRLKKIGIIVTPRFVSTKTGFDGMQKFKKNIWDLCYDEMVIKNPESIKKYYYSGKAFNKTNHGGYNNEAFENQIDYLETIFTDGGDVVIPAQHIHAILYYDYASIFLWRNHTFYIYNKTKIYESIEEMVDSEHFFLTPNKWKLRD